MKKSVFSGLLGVTTIGDIHTMSPKDPRYSCFVELNNFPNVLMSDASSCTVSGWACSVESVCVCLFVCDLRLKSCGSAWRCMWGWTVFVV